MVVVPPFFIENVTPPFEKRWLVGENRLGNGNDLPSSCCVINALPIKVFEVRWFAAELLPPQLAKRGSRQPVQIPKIAIRSTSRRHRALLLPHARSHSPKTPVRNGCSPPRKQLQVARAQSALFRRPCAPVISAQIQPRDNYDLTWLREKLGVSNLRR